MSETTTEDIRTPSQKRAGWWMEPKSRVPCAFTEDGLLCAFRRSDIEALMDRKYPHELIGSQKVWFFNETKDREIADMERTKDPHGQILCNPQVYWTHYQEEPK